MFLYKFEFKSPFNFSSITPASRFLIITKVIEISILINSFNKLKENIEIVKSGGLFKVDDTGVKMTKLMKTVDRPINQLNEIVEELFEYFSHQQNVFQSEKLARYEEETKYFMINWYICFKKLKQTININ